jgi:ribonuclease BN (tRNA processing enzyme)
MRVHLVGAAAPVIGHPLSTFVIDEVLAVDAGALGWWETPEVQARIRDVLISHVHLDHIAGLPAFLENVYKIAPEPPTIHASEASISALQDHLFNNVLMPDFLALSRHNHPFLRYVPFSEDQVFQIGKYEITALNIDHPISTQAFVIDDGTVAVAIVTDTTPIPLILADLTRHPRLKVLFLEASFPNSMSQLAAVSKHFTSGQFLEAARHFPPSVTVIAIHIKMRFFDEVCSEILSANLPNVQIAQPGQILDL